MGWRRAHYNPNREDKLQQVVFNERDGRDLIYNNFVFRNHFFDSYRLRVDDPLGSSRSNLEIAEIASHSFLEADIPSKLGIQSRILIDFHVHEKDSSNSFGLFYVPMRRDKFDIMSGRICVMTILDASEKLSYLYQTGKI